MHELIHTFDMYLLSMYYVTGTILSTGEIEKNEVNKVPASRVHNLMGER